jgi:hypothetical protein
MRITLALALALIAGISQAATAGGSARCRLLDYQQLTESGNTAGVDALVASLRNMGPEMYAQLFDERDRVQEQWTTLANAGDPAIDAVAAELRQIDELIDRVGGARYCTVSRLYWHTDLSEAREASRASGKPILSLRMLGKLTDELSCANSRFFRTTLYSNAEISGVLREHFILHWESVRPVPVITIDFGDGRTMTRTITGNSAHYVLDSEGTPVDCLPGLYSPQAFLAWLTRVEPVAKAVIADRTHRPEILNAYHVARIAAIDQAIPVMISVTDAQAEPASTASADGQIPSQPPQSDAAEIAAIPTDPVALITAQPTAIEAAEVAIPKSRIETPVLANLNPESGAVPGITNEALWQALAELQAGDVALDDSSRDLIFRENPTAIDASVLALTKADIEGPVLAAMFDRLQQNIALDTVRNEYDLHRRIHEWFVSEGPPQDLAAFNERVYAELFLTPSSDPWLGMLDREVYTGLTDAGVVHRAE